MTKVMCDNWTCKFWKRLPTSRLDLMGLCTNKSIEFITEYDAFICSGYEKKNKRKKIK